MLHIKILLSPNCKRLIYKLVLISIRWPAIAVSIHNLGMYVYPMLAGIKVYLHEELKLRTRLKNHPNVTAIRILSPRKWGWKKITIGSRKHICTSNKVYSFHIYTSFVKVLFLSFFIFKNSTNIFWLNFDYYFHSSTS